MNGDKITCKTELSQNIIDKEVYEKELKMCGKLSQENGGKCAWGVCKDCGVIPLLHKLHKGKLLEDSEEIKKVKKEIIL